MSLADEVQYTHVAGREGQESRDKPGAQAGNPAAAPADNPAAGTASGLARPRIEVYALSTCAFCEKALEYLRHRGLAFDYVFVDQLDPEFKRQLKAELKAAYGDIPVFPFLVLDRRASVSGYTPEKYDQLLAGAGS